MVGKQPPKITARWTGREYNKNLDECGDFTFKYPDNAGRRVARMLAYLFTDEVLKEVKAAGYDIKTLRLSIKKEASNE